MIEYAFKVEHWNEDLTEILDCYFLDGLGVKTASKFHDPHNNVFVVLVRSEVNWGMSNDGYAYMRDDLTLPKTFKCALGTEVALVPKRFL